MGLRARRALLSLGVAALAAAACAPGPASPRPASPTAAASSTAAAAASSAPAWPPLASLVEVEAWRPTTGHLGGALALRVLASSAEGYRADPPTPGLVTCAEHRRIGDREPWDVLCHRAGEVAYVRVVDGTTSPAADCADCHDAAPHRPLFRAVPGGLGVASPP